MNAMTNHEKAVHYANAPKAYAGTIEQIDGRKTRRFWVGKLRGQIVTRPADGAWKFQSRAEAVDAARAFREFMRAKVNHLKPAPNAN